MINKHKQQTNTNNNNNKHTTQTHTKTQNKHNTTNTKSIQKRKHKTTTHIANKHDKTARQRTHTNT